MGGFKMKRKLFLFILIIFFTISFVSGCGHQPQIIRHSYVKDYQIEEVKIIYIGQSILKVKDYYVFKGYVKTVLRPTEDFTLTANAPSMLGLSNSRLNISGFKNKSQYESYDKTEVDGILYDIIFPADINGNNIYGVLVDDSGNVKKNALHYKKHIVTTGDFELQPSNVKFIKAVFNYDDFLCDANINYGGNTCGYINHELIYSGINNVSMNIMYREYTRGYDAKTAFYQNLTFEPKAKQVRFKDYVIDIVEATNDKLVFKISSDGLKDTEFTEGSDQGFEGIKSSRK